MKRKKLLFLLWLFCFILISPLSWALDNLFICGEVKRVFKDRILVEVYSESCEGERYFFVKDTHVLKSFKKKIGEGVCFYITTDTCDVDRLVIEKEK